MEGYPPPAHLAPPGDASEGDRARVEELRALGYLGPTHAMPHDASGRSAASYLNEGAARASDDDADGARRAYSMALKLDPENVLARVFAARLFVLDGDLLGARSLLEEARARAPGNVSVRLGCASWALAAHRLQGAALEIAAAEALDARLPQVHLLKARLALAEGRREDAAVALERAEALADTPGLRREVLFLVAEVASALARPAAAAAALRRAEGVASPAEVAIARADLALARGDAGGAVDLLRAASAASPPDSGLLRKLAQAHVAARDFTDAEAVLRQGIASARTAGDLEGGYGELSLVLGRQGRTQEARDLLEAGVARLPSSSVLWGMLGAARGTLGDLEGAIVAYERSVDLKPTPLGCKTLAALLFEERHDRARALALWRQSLDLDPAQDDVRSFLNRYAGKGSKGTIPR